MKSSRMKKALIVSGGCILAGVILLAIGMLVLGGVPGFSIDRTGIHAASDTVEPKTQIMEKTKIEKFENISIDLEYADIEVIPSDGYYLEYELLKYEKPNDSVKGGTLTFQEGEENSTFLNFSFYHTREGSSENVVKVYVPKDAVLNDVELKTSSGDIDIDGTIKLEKLAIEDEYGDISVDTIKAKSVELEISSGDTEIRNVTADSFDLTSEYGGLEIEEYNCKNGEIKMSSGDMNLVKADFNALTAENEYGSVLVGIVHDMNDYDMNITTEYGDIKVPDQYYADDDDEQTYRTNGGTLGEFNVKCDSGDVTITNAK